MEFRFVSRLYYFNIQNALNRGIQVVENVRLSNSTNRFESLFEAPFFQVLIGRLEYDALLDNPFLYAIGEIDSEIHLSEKERLEFLGPYLVTAQNFCNMLWLVKDNSVNVESGFLYILGEGESVTSNMRTSLFLNSSGQYKDENFTDEEVKKGVKLINRLFGGKIEKPNDTHKVFSEANRIERFFYFLQAARAQEFLPNRITLYCTMLETLLSTDTSEITHKIAERTAKILGSDYQERLKYYDLIKDAYSIRSSNIHGDRLRKGFRDLQTLREISKGLDNILRELFLYLAANKEIFLMFHDDNIAELNSWFKEVALR